MLRYGVLSVVVLVAAFLENTDHRGSAQAVSSHAQAPLGAETHPGTQSVTTVNHFTLSEGVLRLDPGNGAGCGSSATCGGVYLVGDDGLQAVISDFNNAAQGPAVSEVRHFVLEDDDSAVVLEPIDGRLIRVDLAGGQRTVITGLRDPGLGPPATLVEGFARTASGDFYVGTLASTDPRPPELIRVDGATGQREVIQDFSDPGEGLARAFARPEHILVEPNGDILVFDDGTTNPFIEGGTYIWHVDPATRQRTVVSDFTDSSQGIHSTKLATVSAAQELSGDILVLAFDGTATRMLLRVDRQTGQRTVLSTLDPQQYPNVNGTSIEVSPSGTILLATAYGSTVRFHNIQRVDPVTGVLSTFATYLVPEDGTRSADLAIIPARLKPGTIIAVDYGNLVADRGRLFLVDPATGQRQILSDFANAAQGPLGRKPWSVAHEKDGDILVLDRDAGLDCFGNGFGCGALFRVNSLTGQRTLLSDLANPAQGAVSFNGWSVDTGPDGAIYVNDYQGLILKVNPVSGARTIVSDWNDPAQGPVGGRPSSIAFLPDGRMIAVDIYQRRLFEVDPTTGERSALIGDFLAGSPLVYAPLSMVEGRGKIFLVDQIGDSCGPCWYGAVIEVDTTTWAYRTLSDFTVDQQGLRGINVSDVALAGPGELYVTDFDGGPNYAGMIYRVDTCSGVRTPLSDFGNPAQGPVGDSPQELIVVGGGSRAADPPCSFVKVAGNGKGRVTSQPEGLNCPALCGTRHEPEVFLVPEPEVGSVFSGWSGHPDCLDGFIVTLLGPRTCTATFTLQNYSLSVDLQTTGGATGTVTSEPAGISCGTGCIAQFGAGQVVELQGSPAAGSMFTGWSGGTAALTNPADLLMDANKSVTAGFAPIPDDAAAAMAVSGNAMLFSFNNSTATQSAQDPFINGPECGGTGQLQHTAWFSRSPAAGVLRVTTAGSAAGTAAVVLVEDVQKGCASGTTPLAVSLAPGEQAMVLAGSWQAGGGDVRLVIESFAASDVNCDHSTAPDDILVALLALSGLEPLSAACPADPDGDGDFTIADALKVRRSVAGLE